MKNNMFRKGMALLLAVPETQLADWEAADVCEDDRLDVFDLALLKCLLTNG